MRISDWSSDVCSSDLELDRALLGPLGLEDRGRVPAVEAELGVGVVVDDDDLVLASEVDELLEEVEVDAGGGGVVGERAHDHARPGPRVLEGVADPPEELPVVVTVAGNRALSHSSTGEQPAPALNRKSVR